eukprot:5053673-Pyramimonas_sp.AAC.1
MSDASLRCLRQLANRICSALVWVAPSAVWANRAPLRATKWNLTVASRPWCPRGLPWAYLVPLRRLGEQ